jgi:hypothetical protein
VEIIPGHRENDSGIERKLFAGTTVRVQPGIAFVFTPERFSRSHGNPVRLAPESSNSNSGSGRSSGPPLSRLWVAR